MMDQRMIYGLARLSQGHVGFMASSSGLRKVTLPHPTLEQALNLLQHEILQGAICDHGAFAPLAARLQRYFAGEPADFTDVALDLKSLRQFQRQVLETVLAIPRGETRSYGQVAWAMGRPGAARAVGRALATNPLCILIPCHRVIASDGSLGGFGGGPALKQQMLEMESAIPAPDRRSPKAASP